MAGPSTEEALAAVALLRQMAEFQPRMVLGAAVNMEPDKAMAYTKELDALRSKWAGLGLPDTANAAVTAAAVGHAIGLLIKPEAKGAGQAVDDMIEICCAILRFTAGEGYAEMRKETANVRD